MSTILYLHGFLSSPQSVKATQTQTYLQQAFKDVNFICPRLPSSPALIASYLEQLLEAHPEILAAGLKVIGSSLGGYLATWLVEQYGGKAVIVNPAVKPYQLLMDYLGEHINPYSGEVFSLTEDDMGYIKALDTPTISDPTCYRVLLQTADETLNYREAETKYQGAQLVIEVGGDHSFVNYQQHLPTIMDFLQLS
jgi:predicted esterase YcpF (UPF0227 family)